MWHNFIEYFLEGLVGAGVAGVIIWRAGRKPLGFALLMAFMFALVISVPQIVFGYFPELHKGWLRFAVGIGIAIVISLPFTFLAQRLSRKP